MMVEEFQYSELNNFLEEFQNESDRAMAILGGAYLDELLCQVLSAYFVDSHKHVKGLFGPNGSLSSFYARIEIAFCLGLISEKDYSDLHYVRKIRNEFAHDIQGLSFRSSSVSDKCKKLHYITQITGYNSDLDAQIKGNARFSFTAEVALLVQRLSKILCQRRESGVKGESKLAPLPWRAPGLGRGSSGAYAGPR